MCTLDLDKYKQVIVPMRKEKAWKYLVNTDKFIKVIEGRYKGMKRYKGKEVGHHVQHTEIQYIFQEIDDIHYKILLVKKEFVLGREDKNESEVVTFRLEEDGKKENSCVLSWEKDFHKEIKGTYVFLMGLLFASVGCFIANIFVNIPALFFPVGGNLGFAFIFFGVVMYSDSYTQMKKYRKILIGYMSEPQNEINV
eukprot:snap_masked-scaffold_80-processed-gene-0.31-mRNA-1 protein AED:1.00 eAED:1.00 QI:0/0/0/0/1/1/2/0/195